MNFLTKSKDQLTLTTSNFIGVFINGIFWFYFATSLDKNDYGELGYLLSFATVGFAFANIGLSSLIVVYGAKKENVLAPAYELGFISTAIVSVIIFLLTNNIFIFLIVWGLSVFNLFTSDQISKKEYITYSKYNLLRRSLVIILAVILYPIFGLNGILLGFFIGTIPAFKVFFKFVKMKKISLSTLKPKAGFITNNYFLDLSQTLFWWGDKLLIGILFGFTILANYQISVQYLLLLQSIPSAVYLYLLPQESEGKSNKKFKFYAIITSGILVLLSITFVPNIVEFFVPEYTESIFPMQIMSISIIPIIISTILESTFMGKEKSKFVLTSAASQLGFYFLFLVIWGEEFGLIGLALAFLFSTIIRTICNIILKIRYFEKKL